MNKIIEIQNIGKEYRLHGHSKPYLSIREDLFKKNKSDKFWALKDVSFDVGVGESVGVIGRNGAGKSTLLKVLSRITPPTKGKIICRGRVASLLEVGTGFHPELTGKENIFLNGSILGLSKAEISSQFDAIVDFSGVEKHLNTPLKHYSSGMQLRLAFSVAAHLEPEILVIDEVLAVGDAAFQKKCLGKMDEVSKSGRTILFVSHNMGAIKNLCSRVVMLERGSLVFDGSTNDGIAHYMHESISKSAIDFSDEQYKNEDFSWNNIRIFQDEIETSSLVSDRPIQASIDFEVFKELQGFRMFFSLENHLGQVLFTSFNNEDLKYGETIQPGPHKFDISIDPNSFIEGRYVLSFYAGLYGTGYLPPTGGVKIPVDITEGSSFNRKDLPDKFKGEVLLPVNWTNG